MNKTEEKKLAKLEAEVERLANEEVAMLSAYRQKHMEKCRAIKEKNQYKLYLNDKYNGKLREEAKKQRKREEAKMISELLKLAKKKGLAEAIAMISEVE